jgi:hypothetical protein
LSLSDFFSSPCGDWVIIRHAREGGYPFLYLNDFNSLDSRFCGTGVAFPIAPQFRDWEGKGGGKNPFFEVIL